MASRNLKIVLPSSGMMVEQTEITDSALQSTSSHLSGLIWRPNAGTVRFIVSN